MREFARDVAKSVVASLVVLTIVGGARWYIEERRERRAALQSQNNGRV